MQVPYLFAEEKLARPSKNEVPVLLVYTKDVCVQTFIIHLTVALETVLETDFHPCFVVSVGEFSGGIYIYLDATFCCFSLKEHP